MPAPSRNEIAEKHRVQRRESSPYNQRGRKEKMAASRGWRPTIWKALTFWRGGNDEDSDPSEEVFEPNTGENGKDAEAEERAVEDGNDVDSSSVMNSSIVSEDQVFRQLISPTPRQVRFQLPSPSHNSRRISPPQPGSSSTPFTFPPRQQPYVAPLPPSSSLNRQDEDPLTKVSQYLDNVVRPRGGNCTEMEALGLSMLIQSAVKGSNSANSTPSRDVSPNRKPFVFPTPDTPLKPTFTAPNTNFAAIFSKPDSTTISSTQSASPSRPLTRNPNGNVMFQGGGSAKSRYRSPAFGTPSSRKKIAFSRDFGGNKTGSGNGISNSTSSVNDGKRRRVDEEESNWSTVQSSGSSSQATTSSSSLDSQTKENGNGTALHNGHGSAAGPSRAQPTTSAPVRLGGSNRFMATTPVRPSPLRQSMRADSSSPGSPSSNRSTPEAKTNGSIAKQSQARAVAIMAEIIQSASQPKNEQTSALNADIANPYDTRPASKRARKSTKPARPPPRPVRRAVSAETPPPPEPPRKPTALETIERTAPMSVQAQSKRVHAEMIGLSQSSKPKSKQPSPVNHDVIEIDDDDEEPPAKRARPEKARPTIEPIKESMEVIDIDDDGDVDMATPAPPSTANVLRPSEIIEPTDAELSDSSKPTASRTLYPTSLSKVSGGFGVTPKKPSPLRNSFQPESDSSTSTPKPKPFERTTNPTSFGSTFTPGFSVAPVFPSTLSNDESSKVSSGSTSFTSTSTSTTTSLFGSGSSFSSNTSFGSTFSAAKFGPSSTEDKILATAPNTNGFTLRPTTEFPPSNTISLQSVTQSFQFGSNSSTSFVPTKVDDNERAIKKAILAMSVSDLPVFRFAKPVTVMDDYFAERNGALALSMKALPKFTFDTKAAPKPASAPVAPPKSEVKGFDWSAAGVKAPASSGWTCSLCSVPNKSSDSKCVCCGENAPAPSKTETKGFNWSAAGMKAPVSNGWTCSLCSVPNKVSDSKCVCCGENKS